MHKFARCFALATTLAAAPLTVCAEGPGIHWNVSAVSDYLFRSVSQTDENPTLQGEFRWVAPFGAYAGTWASGVDYGSGTPHVEVDYYLGYQTAIDRFMHLDARLSRYTTPGDSDFAWHELSTITTLFDSSWKIGLNYSPRMGSEDSRGWYFSVGNSWALPLDLSLSAHAGRTTFESNARANVHDFTDWNVGLSRSFGLAKVSLGYYGTDSSGRRNAGKLANSRMLLSVRVGGSQ